ncbi:MULTISPECIES: ThiF family adenylyltransferase [Corynebacterium]|uniref:THIF-type NAD/FAD binding fold domain-containing protein n=1 Tax=Corynebacterium gottingense TaxID=2041036 RepID=A0ABX9UI77_9CORY|nr:MULTISPECIES: ThiF family adenylyltransferase [Corynebacterium]MCG7254934.1 ThiF family adenylyltransferase [Corynebacterium hadale]MCG7257173.1 ThiF family adenylyltransferase [Corynebacterium hadale]MCG7265804.1 ThiF family adenylyltransferase [Corynebacterium hadale]PAT04918.1 hypothetical protein CKJ85_01975 [Corynebacterium sp. NML 150383]PAT07933.1 hypothetical protein CKJ82_08380 [Corynebacterium hadale]
MNGDRQRLRGHYDEDFYWERVDRNLGWLGDTTEEQRERQARLRDAVIGIVGTGGIGGAAAARLVRMGALNLKLADPDHFDLTNVQRQYGAGRDTIGRNKAEIRDMHFAASWRLFDLVLPTLLDRSYRTWDQDLSKRTYFGHPPAEASLESRV